MPRPTRVIEDAPVQPAVKPAHYCALQYRTNSDATAAAGDFVMVLALQDQDGFLRFLVHPRWREIVRPEHLAYLESVLEDFPKRARIDPDSLFEQLCSLSVGPLVTHSTGANLGLLPYGKYGPN